MSWLDFTASVINSVAWPTVMITAVILLRRPLATLLPLLRRLKYKDLEVEFAREVQELREEAEAALPPLPTGAPPRIPEEEALLKLVSVSPRAAVVEAWRVVEGAARRALEARGEPIEPGKPLSGPQLTKTLMYRQVLDHAARSLLDRLRMLRNQAVHAEDFSVDVTSAREYLELALALARRLRAEAG